MAKKKKRATTKQRHTRAEWQKVISKILVNLSSKPADNISKYGSLFCIAFVVMHYLSPVLIAYADTETRLVANLKADIKADISYNKEKNSVEKLKNKLLSANRSFYLMSAVSVSAVILAIFCLLLVFRSEKLRKRAIADMSGQNVFLEKLIDKNRTSSGLLNTGDTNPKD